MKLQSLHELIRFRLVEVQGHLYLVSATTSAAEPAAEEAPDPGEGTRWTTLSIDLEANTSARLVDLWREGDLLSDFDLAILDDGHCLWAVATNAPGAAVVVNEVEFASFEECLPPLAKGPQIPALPPVTRQRDLEATELWSAPLSPKQWLFGPRVRPGSEGDWHLSANMAKGELLVLRGPLGGRQEELSLGAQPENWAELDFAPVGLDPIAIQTSAGLVTAFRKVALERSLFFSLSRYAGPTPDEDPTGNLAVKLASGETVDVSEATDLGPVRAFDLALAGPGRLVAATLHEQAGQTILSVVESRDGGAHWSRRAAAGLEGFASMLSLVAYGRDASAAAAYSLTEGDFAVIELMEFPGGP